MGSFAVAEIDQQGLTQGIEHKKGGSRKEAAPFL